MRLTDQDSLFEVEEARLLIDQLIEDSRLYTTTASYFELLRFTSQMRSFAPFNAMLLHIQKPGLSFAASAYDWKNKFGRTPKIGARPLMILWPFGPVAFVYDVLDTEGSELPEDVSAFWARGEISANEIHKFIELLAKKSIFVEFSDSGDNAAGSIRALNRVEKPIPRADYNILLNSNHPPAVQLVTLAHELAHLYLGHMGDDSDLQITGRPGLPEALLELEAESVAYLVATRTQVQSKSEKYLSDYVQNHDLVGNLDLYMVMRAAGLVESVLGLHRGISFGPKPKRDRKY